MSSCAPVSLHFTLVLWTNQNDQALRLFIAIWFGWRSRCTVWTHHTLTCAPTPSIPSIPSIPSDTYVHCWHRTVVFVYFGVSVKLSNKTMIMTIDNPTPTNTKRLQLFTESVVYLKLWFLILYICTDTSLQSCTKPYTSVLLVSLR